MRINLRDFRLVGSEAPQARAACIGLVFALAIVATLCCIQLRRTHDRITSDQRNRLQTQARVVADQVAKQLAAVDHALAGILAQLPPVTSLRVGQSTRLEVLVSAMPGVVGITLLDPSGTVLVSDKVEQVGQKVGERKYVEVGKANPASAGLFISPPFNSARGLAISLSKPLFADSWQSNGMIKATLDPAFFEAIARSVLYADDMTATIVHREGKLFVDAQHSGSLLGRDVSGPATFFSKHVFEKRRESVMVGFDVVRDRERMVALQTVTSSELQQDIPLVVSVGRDLAPIYQHWREDVLLYSLFFGLLATGSTALLVLLAQRRIASMAAERARLAQASENARRMEFGLESAKLGLWELDLRTDAAILNERELHILGYKGDVFSIKPRNWRQIVPIADWGLIEVNMCGQLRHTERPYIGEHRLRHKEGRLIWVATHAIVTERDVHGRPQRVLGTHMDISDRKTAELAMAATAQRLQLAMKAGEMGSIDWHVPTGQVSVNARGYEMVGLTPTALEHDPKRWFDSAHSDDKHRTDVYLKPLLDGEVPLAKCEYRLLHSDGHFVWIDMSVQLYERGADGEALRVIGAFRDITERVTFARDLQQMNDRLARLTVTDGLTGVGNRRMFDVTFEQEWSRCARQSLPLSVLMMDIDEFKAFNDLYGHQAGDAALIEVGQVLTHSVQRAGECVARYGGEEFVILLPGSDEAHALTVAALCKERLAAARIRHAASKVSPFLSASIGVASTCPALEIAPSSLLKAADLALYKAKEAGRNQIRVAGLAV